MKYRPLRTVIGVPSTPWVAVCGGEATRRRAESWQARPPRGHRSGTEPGSAGEASSACVSAPMRVHSAAPQCARRACRWPGAMAFRRAPRVGMRPRPRPRLMCRRGGRRSRTCRKLGRCQVSWKNTAQSFRLGGTLLSCSPLLQGIRVKGDDAFQTSVDRTTEVTSC